MNCQNLRAMSVQPGKLSERDRFPNFMEKVANANISTKLKKKVARKTAQIASLPAQIAWHLSEHPRIEKHILYPRYQKALKEHESKLPALDPADSKIVDELARTGICITSLESLGLPNTTEFLEAAKKLSTAVARSSLLPANKNVYETHATSAQLMECMEVFNWGLNERLLKIVESYLRLPVAYDGVSCVLSIANGMEIGARAWHRDREDRHMIKVCVYLNDVDEDGGPFQCLKPEFNRALCKSVKHRYKSVFHEELKQFSPTAAANEVVSCTGQAGTVIFVDTAHNYHRGKPPTQSNRSALFFSYFSRRPWHPFFCRRSPLSKKELGRLIPDISSYQQACVNWHDDLPKAVKWLPASRT